MYFKMLYFEEMIYCFCKRSCSFFSSNRFDSFLVNIC